MFLQLNDDFWWQKSKFWVQNRICSKNWGFDGKKGNFGLKIGSVGVGRFGLGGKRGIWRENGNLEGKCGDLRGKCGSFGIKMGNLGAEWQS